MDPEFHHEGTSWQVSSIGASRKPTDRTYTMTVFRNGSVFDSVTQKLIRGISLYGTVDTSNKELISIRNSPPDFIQGKYYPPV